jgi:hypothetical protein
LGGGICPGGGGGGGDKRKRVKTKHISCALFHIVRLASTIQSYTSTLDSHNLLYTKSPILFPMIRIPIYVFIFYTVHLAHSGFPLTYVGSPLQ